MAAPNMPARRSGRRLQMKHLIQLHHQAKTGQLASEYFHDVMNSLTAVTLAMENITAHGDHIEYAHNRLRDAVKASRHMGMFMQASQPPTLYGEDLNQPLSLRQELSNAIALFKHRTYKQNIIFKLSARGTAITRCNPIHFRHIINNLLSHAINSYQDGYADSLNIIKVGVVSRQSHITVSIADYGNNTAKEALALLCDPLKSPFLDPEQNFNLVIAHHLIKTQLHGTLTIQPNNANNGITITVAFETPHHS